MQKGNILIAIGILDLFFSYILFNSNSLFSVIEMLGIFILAFVSAILFYFSYAVQDKQKVKNIIFVSTILSAIIVILEMRPQLSYFIRLSESINVALLFSTSAFIAVIGIYAITLFTAKISNKKISITIAVLCLLVVASLSYIVVYLPVQNYLQFSDEAAFNYYSAYLFIHGSNPYTSSMQHILDKYGISGTTQLNGTTETNYVYPPLSFILLLFLPLLGFDKPYVITFINILFQICVAFIIYQKAKSKWILLPIFVWLLLSFYESATIIQYISISFFLLLAYLYKERTTISAIFLGLAASTIQLAWFALPFFYVLAFREYGIRKTLKYVAISIGILALFSSYFLFIDYKAYIGNLVLPLSVNKLIFYGPTAFQFLLAFYHMPYIYSSILSILFYVLLLVLFLLYTEKFKPLIAIVPAFIFFLSWRNLIIYSLPYIPLLLAVNLDKKDTRQKDKIKFFKYFLVLVLFATFLGIYLHSYYLQKSSLVINKITPVIYLGINQSQSLNSILVNITNKEGIDKRIIFYVASINPSGGEYLYDSNYNVPADASGTFKVGYTLPYVSNATNIQAYVFSDDYYAAKSLSLRLK